jgi:hypothetical protein
MQGEGTSAGLTLQFHDMDFEENLSLCQLMGVIADARISAHEFLSSRLVFRAGAPKRCAGAPGDISYREHLG